MILISSEISKSFRNNVFELLFENHYPNTLSDKVTLACHVWLLNILNMRCAVSVRYTLDLKTYYQKRMQSISEITVLI